jgi:hypothetical protein
MRQEIQRKILGVLYEKWFKNHSEAALSLQSLISQLDLVENEASQSVEILLSNALVKKNNISWYVITFCGIDTYEENLPPSLVSNRKQERRMVLESLLESYNRNINQRMNNKELANLIQINDPDYLLAIVEYLGQKGLVSLKKYVGGGFHISLSALGFQSLQDLTIDNAVIMVGAYRILFSLENRFRQFIESTMRSKRGAEWWNECVSNSIKKKVDHMRQAERSLGWQVSATNSNAEYLLFEDLEKIITTNWKEVFEPFFQDQQKITHRLKELEGIRNSIAHTRILSMDGMNRLEQYSQDLLNMIDFHTN